MLTRYILLLRRAPRSMQERHALFWALSVTLIVGMAWGLSLPNTLKPLPKDGLLAEEHTRPLGSLWGQAREQFASIMESFSATSTATSTANTNEVNGGLAVETTTSTPEITLSPEDIDKARARANILYRPTSTPVAVATTTTATTMPRVVQIATTTSPATPTARP